MKTWSALSAASSGQVSNSYPEAQHGLFTYYLLRGIGGEADANDDRWITVKEIYSFVKASCHQRVAQEGHRADTDDNAILGQF